MMRARIWSIVSLVAVLLLLGLGLARPAVADDPPPDPWLWPRISIVWPHDASGQATPVLSSTAVNISVWPSAPVRCDQPPPFPITLWQARNNEPAEPVAIPPHQILRTGNGFKFPSLEYSDVPADLAHDPTAQYRFFVIWGNVWVHAGDPRTYLPEPVVPTGYSSLRPPQLDTRIQIVWPHDEQGAPASVATATRVNIAVDIFEHGTLNSVPPEFPEHVSEAPIHVFVAAGNGVLNDTQTPGARITSFWALSEKTTYTVGDKVYPRWVFNDVPVQPGVPYHFLVYIYGSTFKTFPSVWTHAEDPRTILPMPQMPDYGGRASEFGCAP